MMDENERRWWIGRRGEVRDWVGYSGKGGRRGERGGSRRGVREI
jgi:hypothetical protein